MDLPPLVVLALTLAVIVIVFVLGVRSGDKMLAEQKAKLDRALPGEASVFAYEETRFGGRDEKGRFISVRFDLEVRLPDKPPYQATTTWKVYPMGIPQLQVGNVIRVKVDADDPQAVYPNMPSAEYNWFAAQAKRQS